MSAEAVWPRSRPRPADELVRAVARAVPLCVVLDDFHWADGQSVALLKHVVRAVEEAPVHVVVTYRDSDLTRDHPLTGALADLRRIDGVERIALAGLGADEVAELVGAAAGHELDADGLALAARNRAVISEVAGRFPLDQSVDAYRALEGGVHGKVLVIPGQSATA